MGSRFVPIAVGAWLAGAASLAGQGLADYDYENLRLRGLGVEVGSVWPNKVAQTLTYGFRADLGYLGPGVRIASSLAYWSSELRQRELDRLAAQLNRLPALRDRGVRIDGEDLGAIDWADLGVGLDGQYVWVLPARVLGYLGLGAAVHVLNGSGSLIADTFVEDLLDTVTAGLSLLGGLELEPLPRLRVYGEVRYTLLSDLRYPGLRVGGTLLFPGAGGDEFGAGAAGGARRGR